MVLLKRKRTLAAKVETTPGTAETLTGTEGAFNAYDVMIQPTIAVDAREKQGNFGSLPGVPGARMGKATFKTDLAYDGTNVPSWASVLLPACGYVNSTGTFTPRSEAPGTNVKTATIGCYQDGVLKRIAGAVGNFKITFPTGRACVIEWEFTGVWLAPTDTALITPTYPSETPIRFASGLCELADVALKVEQVVFDAGNEIVMIEDPSTAAGYSHGVVTNRLPKITANPLAVLVATQDRFGDWLAATEMTWELDLDGPSDSVITLDCPKVQITNNQEADRGRLVVDQLDLAVLRSTAAVDQDAQLIFTPAT